jgi:Undecaprenyl-phosphate glucose phosphotransferase
MALAMHIAEINARDPLARSTSAEKPLHAAAPIHTQAISVPVLTMAVRAADFLLAAVAGAFAALALKTLLGSIPTGHLAISTCIGAAAFVVAAGQSGCYDLAVLSRLEQSAKRLLAPLLISGTAVIVAMFMLYDGTVPLREWPIGFVAIGSVLILSFRLALANLIRHWRESGRLIRRVAVVGVSDFGAMFLQRLAAQPDLFQVAGVYDDRHSRIPEHLRHIAVQGGVEALLRASRTERIDMVVLALPLMAAERINLILMQLGSLVADVFLTADVAGMRYEGTQFTTIGANPVVAVDQRPIKDWQAVRKALFDRVLGTALLLLLLPVLLSVALLIKLDSPGPVLFRQPRVGFDNRMFSIFKFRTMRADQADLLADRQTTRGDPRITRVGHWLRRYSLDELPQLLNVLGGTMSLVGPRPHAPNTKAADRLFADVVGQYTVRHRVKPGITGWAQVNGWRGETRTEEQLRQRVRHDLDYIKNWSLWLDVKIIALTLMREVRSTTAF